MEQKNRTQEQAGIRIMDLVITMVNIVGMGIVPILLKIFTRLPFWACALLGIPLFFIAFWGFLDLFVGRRNARSKTRMLKK